MARLRFDFGGRRSSPARLAPPYYHPSPLLSSQQRSCVADLLAGAVFDRCRANGFLDAVIHSAALPYQAGDRDQRRFACHRLCRSRTCGLVRPSADRFRSRGVFRAVLAGRNSDRPLPARRRNECDRDSECAEHSLDAAAAPAEAEGADRALARSSSTPSTKAFEAWDLATISPRSGALTAGRPAGPSRKIGMSTTPMRMAAPETLIESREIAPRVPMSTPMMIRSLIVAPPVFGGSAQQYSRAKQSCRQRMRLNLGSENRQQR